MKIIFLHQEKDFKNHDMAPLSNYSDDSGGNGN